jgi:hypothetical protein
VGGICKYSLKRASLADPGVAACPAPGYATRFVDNHDGTVTDNLTKLQWEKKTDDSTVHDKDNTYSWNLSGSPYPPDGTAFTSFLATLNGGTTGVGDCASSDGSTQTGGFAGHCDWRLPTVTELQTILLAPSPCGTSPCIDATFGPTVANDYWSSTTNTAFPYLAWFVFFDTGTVFNTFKSNTFPVRAVRGGP